MFPREKVLECALVVGTKGRSSLLHSLCSSVDFPALSSPTSHISDQVVPEATRRRNTLVSSSSQASKQMIWI
eukprot:585176-Hanusia_phi.AAC.2